MTRIRWDKHSIKAEIYRRGFTLASLAHELNLRDFSINVSLRRKFFKSDAALADWLGVPKHILWPDRYLECGRSLPQQRKPSRRRRRYTSQKRNRRIGRKEAA